MTNSQQFSIPKGTDLVIVVLTSDVYDTPAKMKQAEYDTRRTIEKGYDKVGRDLIRAVFTPAHNARMQMLWRQSVLESISREEIPADDGDTLESVGMTFSLPDANLAFAHNTTNVYGGVDNLPFLGGKRPW